MIDNAKARIREGLHHSYLSLLKYVDLTVTFNCEPRLAVHKVVANRAYSKGQLLLVPLAPVGVASKFPASGVPV
eukprot:3792975-Pyramimonas_sp.AAC.1